MAYVYQHVRLDTNEIFYIGISGNIDGIYKRAYSKRRGNFWLRIIGKTNYRVDIILDNLTLTEAKIQEIKLIKFYGRKSLNEGTLVNLTDGGDGVEGYKHSEEIKTKISNSKVGHTVTEEAKKKISESNKGKFVTNETKQKLSLSLKGKKKKKVTDVTKQKMSKSAISRGIKIETRIKSKETRRLNKLKGIKVKCPEKVFCENCKKNIDVRNFKRWHQNCDVLNSKIQNVYTLINTKTKETKNFLGYKEVKDYIKIFNLTCKRGEKIMYTELTNEREYHNFILRKDNFGFTLNDRECIKAT